MCPHRDTASMTTRRAFPVVLATALVLWLLLPLRGASARSWITKASQDGSHPTLYIMPSHLIRAEDLEDDVEREVPVVVPTLIESPRPMPRSAVGMRTGDIGPAMNKRQVRYHQCYFNPISCFG